MKLTVARYYHPSGRSIQAEGIKPDVTVEEVYPEQFKKAIIRKDVRREQDLGRHLLSDKEKEKTKDQDATSMSYWFKQDMSKKTNLSPRDKLLQDDFQVLQAFNYIRAWKVMEKFDGPAASQGPTNKE